MMILPRRAVSLVVPLLLLVQASGEEAGPIQKVIELLGEMQAKAIKEGQAEQGQFEDFSRWCEKSSTEKQNTIADEKEQIVGLQATIDTASANIEQLKAVVEQVSADVSANEAELKGAIAIREKEHTDFLARDKDLGETVDMLMRAQKVLKEHAQNAKAGGAALLQTDSLNKVTSTFRSIVDASFVNLEDKDVLSALLQQTEDDGSLEVDADVAPAQGSTNAYESKSGGIIDTMQNLEEKAEGSRNEAQKEEMNAAHNFAMLKQSLEAEIASLKAQLDDAKKKMNKNDEVKATATGDLEAVTTDLADDEKALADVQRECMDEATAFETSQRSRAEELKVMATAKKILENAGKKGLMQISSGSADATSADPQPLSFLQTKVTAKAKAQATMFSRQLQAASYLEGEGNRLNSWVLAQIGSRLTVDPFAKVKDMISQMVEKLLEEQAEEAEHKAWCDEEMGKSKKALGSKKAKTEDLATRIARAKAQSEKLQEQVKATLGELKEMDAAQQEATEMRQKAHAEFVEVKGNLEAGQKATATAVKVLRSYYEGKSFLQTDASSTLQFSNQQPSGGGAAGAIIGMLEVAEADFSRNLADVTAAEDQAQEEYDTLMQDTKVSRAAKEADVKGKSAEIQSLDNTVAETEVDQKEAQTELDAVAEYLDKLKGDCETKTPSFEERQLRRKQEMEGLQNALSILDGNAIAMLQSGSVQPGMMSDGTMAGLLRGMQR